MKMSKKLRLLLSLTALLVCFGCNVVKADEQDDYYYYATEEMTTSVDDVTFYADGAITLTQVKEMAASYAYNLSKIASYTPEEWDYALENVTGTDIYEKFYEVCGKEGIGTYVNYDNVAVEEKGDNNIIITTDIHFTDADFTLKVDVVIYPNIGQVVNGHEFVVHDASDSSDTAKGEDTSEASVTDRMLKALENTLLGMGTVFVVLILISLIISCFAFIPKIQAALTKKNEKIEPVITESIVNEPAVKSNTVENDAELIAVIAAAIAASENTTTDGFVVRSIRKRISR